MDVQVYLNRLELMWAELASFPYDSVSARDVLHRIGALEAETKNRFHGMNTRVAQLRARGLLRYHLPQLLRANHLEMVDINQLHGMLRRLVQSKAPFHMRLEDEVRRTDETSTVTGILSEIKHIVEHVDDPVTCRNRLHELIIELRAIVAADIRKPARTLFVPWKDPNFNQSAESALS